MTRRVLDTLRTSLRGALLRRVGERRLPVGNVAADRRLLRRALPDGPGDRVLVVGPGLAARQAFPGARIDVAGTSPHSAEVTICSAVAGPRSLPAGRWSTVIVMEPGADPDARLDAAGHACRHGGTLLLVDRSGHDEHSREAVALARNAAVVDVVGRPDRRAWVARVPQ